jgi:enoyl-CoA hydratase/carnithine racemase
MQCYATEARFTAQRYWLEYGAAFDRIAEDPTVRVVVLSSALEKAFSAGVDRAWIIHPLLFLTPNASDGNQSNAHTHQYPTSSHSRRTQTPRAAPF